MRPPPLLLLLLPPSLAFVKAFLPPPSVTPSRQPLPASSPVRVTSPLHRPPTPTPLLALFDDDDLSTFNALCQFGPAPAIVRITQPEKFQAAVAKYMREESCSELVATRNMDAFFSDPSGWVLARGREEKFGEVADYTRKSGVQKRPLFSAFWAAFCFWFFLSFLPHRVQELGGFHPSVGRGGLCVPDVRRFDEQGRQQFECSEEAKQWLNR